MYLKAIKRKGGGVQKQDSIGQFNDFLIENIACCTIILVINFLKKGPANQ